MKLASALFLVPVVCGCKSGDTPGGADASTANDRVCDATLTTMGSFVPDPAATPPADSTGCWPAGTWTFTAAVTQNDCTTAPVPESQYQFKGVQTADMNGDPIVDTFTYLNDPTNPRVIVKVSEGGSGLCEGELTIYSTDGTKVWLLKPELNADNTITGDGEYGEFTSDQWPF
ncbi:MAG: hypothetical protein ABI467_13310 [Kofleriaceae bacterium]